MKKTIEDFKRIIKEKIKEQKEKANQSQRNESIINKDSKKYKAFSKFMDQMKNIDFDMLKTIDEIVEQMANKPTVENGKVYRK